MMNISIIEVGSPTYNEYRKLWVSNIKFRLSGGSLDFKKLAVVASSWAGSVSYQSVLVSDGGIFYLSFGADSLSVFTGKHVVNLKIEGGETITAEIDFPIYIKPYYTSTWEAGERPTLKVGDCSCVTIECVGLKPGGAYRLENILRKTGKAITSMGFTGNSEGVYRTSSTAEIPENMPIGAYDVRFYGPGLAAGGVVVDYFEIEARLQPPGPITPTPKCPPDKPICEENQHPEAVYATVQPAACPISGWDCVDNVDGGTPTPPKPFCRIQWAAPYSGKIGSRKQGEVVGVKITAMNLQPNAEFRLQNVYKNGSEVISETTVSADGDGVLVFEDNQSLLPFDWPLGSYNIRLLGSGVSIICGGFEMSQGTPVCAPGLVLSPGGQCLPVAVDRKLWIFAAVVAVIFLISRR